MNHIRSLLLSLPALLCAPGARAAEQPVDYVNPHMGGISHLLAPTRPTVQVPYGMLRLYPQRGSYVDGRIDGLPVLVLNHRENCCFNLSATQAADGELHTVMRTDYDNECITPYSYRTDLDQQRVEAEVAPAEHSAVYRFAFRDAGDAYVLLRSADGQMHVEGRSVSGYQNTWGGIRVYLYGETDAAPAATGIVRGQRFDATATTATGGDACVALRFDGPAAVTLRYAVSLIDVEQARLNFRAEVAGRSLEQVKAQARDRWNAELGRIAVDGGSRDHMAVFYTSLYRCMERPVCISEQGRYRCPADHQVHSDQGRPFYTDDWLWDTFRAAHPLRTLIDPAREADMVHSLVRTAECDPMHWFPTFPAATGDSRRMNCNHGVAVVADAWGKGIRAFDLDKAYDYCRRAIEQKTLAPWSSHTSTWLDTFYRDHGYIPALWPGERETVEGVNGFEKRQAVAVTLGTSYDQWCLSVLAAALGRRHEADHYARCSLNYRNLYNPATGFFHPKDKQGRWIEPFDYRSAGGLGARDYYDENNGWTYRWLVQHNPADLARLMGGAEQMARQLDQTFDEWLGRSRYEFYAQLPDHTGNVGQFSMANEPSLHIPYLYNYVGRPWQTQRRVHSLIDQWFRNDLMGVPGDEDGGGLSGFVVMSMMGLYAVTPGMPVYNLSSPFFDTITIALPGGKQWRIQAPGASQGKVYVEQATVGGKPWSKPWIAHETIARGGGITFELGLRRTAWGSLPHDAPPSAGDVNPLLKTDSR